jgi:hypothetical protein
MLGINTGTSKSQLHRARMVLRGYLSHAPGGAPTGGRGRAGSSLREGKADDGPYRSEP